MPAHSGPEALADAGKDTGLVSALIEHDIGVRRQSYDLIELADDDFLTDGSHS
jgi:hypothetical protein